SFHSYVCPIHYSTYSYSCTFCSCFCFFLHPPPPTDIYTLSLHDALPIYLRHSDVGSRLRRAGQGSETALRPVGGWTTHFRSTHRPGIPRLLGPPTRNGPADHPAAHRGAAGGDGPHCCRGQVHRGLLRGHDQEDPARRRHAPRPGSTDLGRAL